jgi:hypothetical protein
MTAVRFQKMGALVAKRNFLPAPATTIAMAMAVLSVVFTVCRTAPRNEWKPGTNDAQSRVRGMVNDWIGSIQA